MSAVRHELAVRLWPADDRVTTIQFTAHCRCSWGTRDAAFAVIANRVEGHLTQAAERGEQ